MNLYEHFPFRFPTIVFEDVACMVQRLYGCL